MLDNSAVWSQSAEAQDEQAARSATMCAIRRATASLPHVSNTTKSLCRTLRSSPAKVSFALYDSRTSACMYIYSVAHRTLAKSKEVLRSDVKTDRGAG